MFDVLVCSDYELPGKLAALNIASAGSVLWMPKETRGITCVPQLAVHSLIWEKLPPRFTRWLPCDQMAAPFNCLTGLLRREKLLALYGTVTKPAMLGA